MWPDAYMALQANACDETKGVVRVVGDSTSASIYVHGALNVTLRGVDISEIWRNVVETLNMYGSEEPEDEPASGVAENTKTTYTERVAANIQRNKEHLASLGIVSLKPKVRRKGVKRATRPKSQGADRRSARLLDKPRKLHVPNDDEEEEQDEPVEEVGCGAMSHQSSSPVSQPTQKTQPACDRAIGASMERLAGRNNPDHIAVNDNTVFWHSTDHPCPFLMDKLNEDTLDNDHLIRWYQTYYDLSDANDYPWRRIDVAGVKYFPFVVYSAGTLTSAAHENVSRGLLNVLMVMTCMLESAYTSPEYCATALFKLKGIVVNDESMRLKELDELVRENRKQLKAAMQTKQDVSDQMLALPLQRTEEDVLERQCLDNARDTAERRIAELTEAAKDVDKRRKGCIAALELQMPSKKQDVTMLLEEIFTLQASGS